MLNANNPKHEKTQVNNRKSKNKKTKQLSKTDRQIKTLNK